MNFTSSQELCLHLISAAFQRCRVSEELCRLSVLLKPAHDFDQPIVQVSVSDTGIGCSLAEFQDLKLSREVNDAGRWDGVVSVTTTRICDIEIHHFQLNLKESVSARRLISLPSNPKNGLKFSGTEVCLSISESMDVLQAKISRFFQKMLMLKVPNIAIELMVEHGNFLQSRNQYLFLANEFNPLPFSTSNLERLKSGLGDYILKHGNTLDKPCLSCFPNFENLKIGRGVSCQENNRSDRLVMEAAIVMSEITDSSTGCFRTRSGETEVFYFQDFTSCSISQSSLKALKSTDWKSYGLTLGSLKDEGDCILIEWEGLPPFVHIDMVLHLYHDEALTPSRRQKVKFDRNLIKKTVKLALDDLRDKHAGLLLSATALKIRSYAPDLARTIAGLISSSHDSNFQEECYSLLGLQAEGAGSTTVENCLKEKIISVIEINDRKSPKNKETAPVLFEGDDVNESEYNNEEYEVEDCFSAMDI